MALSYDLRELRNSDHFVVREIYADAICSQGLEFYNQDQINAWSALAFLPGVLDRSLNEGNGWLIKTDGFKNIKDVVGKEV